LRISDILASVDRIGRYTAGHSQDSFSKDEKTVEAVCFALVVIGEAAAHVPEEARAMDATIPWAKMKGMRNIAAHEYFGIDVATVWQTATVDVPALKPALMALRSR
jgi:hypothetical protein